MSCAQITEPRPKEAVAPVTEPVPGTSIKTVASPGLQMSK
jgi:hypothetical protein